MIKTMDINSERVTWDKPINPDDQKILLRIIVDNSNKAKKAGRTFNAKGLYEAAPQFETLYVDAMLAKLVAEERIFVEEPDKTIYLSF
jgi:hypothetical protein